MILLSLSEQTQVLEAHSLVVGPLEALGQSSLRVQWQNLSQGTMGFHRLLVRQRLGQSLESFRP